MEEDYRKYMEGNYDGDSKQQYKQMKDDKRQAKRIAEEIKTVQEAILESETERLSYEYKVENKEFEELIKSYKLNQITKEEFTQVINKLKEIKNNNETFEEIETKFNEYKKTLTIIPPYNVSDK